VIDLLPDADQQQVVDSVAGLLARDFPVERLRPGKASREHDRWADLAAQGWFGLGLAEAAGGAGFTAVEEVLVHREFGRFLVTPSVFATAVAAHLAEAAGDRKLASALASGEARASVASPAGRLALGPVIDGELHLIDAAEGDLILLMSVEGAALLDRAALTDIRPAEALDESITLERARALEVRPRLFVPTAAAPVRRRAVLLIAAALVGMAESARDLAVAYAGVRTQFGKLIGSFQGVAHHCADMELRASAARAQVSFAAVAERDGRSHAAFQAAAAGLAAADAALKNTPLAIRVHGAMGYTAECELHLYLERAHLLERLMGGTRALQADLMAEPSPDLSAASSAAR
jgi:alkylation response protein AidB-like acyl-CoA dehydrogenase